MNTISESTFKKINSLEITTTSIYKIDGDNKFLIKQIELKHWTDNNYLQTHIYDEWGYKILWFDNHGAYQHFDRKVKTVGKSTEIGKMEGDSWFITNTKNNIFGGKQYHPKDFKLMRERFFCEPHPPSIKEMT